MCERIFVVAKWFKFFSHKQSTFALRGTTDGVTQTLLLESSVIAHVTMHRQLKPLSTEAGGAAVRIG